MNPITPYLLNGGAGSKASCRENRCVPRKSPHYAFIRLIRQKKKELDLFKKIDEKPGRLQYLLYQPDVKCTQNDGLRKVPPKT